MNLCTIPTAVEDPEGDQRWMSIVCYEYLHSI